MKGDTLHITKNMIKSPHNEDNQTWHFFKGFLSGLSPIYLQTVEKVLKEVDMLRSGEIDYYKVSSEYFQLVVWINENYKGQLSSYDGLLKVMESCDKPYGEQKIFTDENY